jgi:modified peptide precursor CbpA
MHQDVMTYRLECEAEDGGLTHYVMMGDNSPF